MVHYHRLLLMHIQWRKQWHCRVKYFSPICKGAGCKRANYRVNITKLLSKPCYHRLLLITITHTGGFQISHSLTIVLRYFAQWANTLWTVRVRFIRPDSSVRFDSHLYWVCRTPPDRKLQMNMHNTAVLLLTVIYKLCSQSTCLTNKNLTVQLKVY